MVLTVTPSGQSCGAEVRGIDLTEPLAPDEVRQIRTAWIAHKVLSFPNQKLSDADQERFTLYFGPFGEDPFFEPIDDHPNVAAISRRADETSSLFAENWHADWSFQEFPPDGTCLASKIVPPHGGNTEFTDQVAAYEALPNDLRAWADGATVIHSARGGYAPDGAHGQDDVDRSMKIRFSETAYQTQSHPLVRPHPESGARTLYSCLGYIIGVEGMDDSTARPMLRELLHWQGKPEFRYTHQWQPDMLVMWDNRCVLHRATGGYDGYERLLHRTTIGYNPAFS